MAKNTGKVREKSGNFVSPEKWEPCGISKGFLSSLKTLDQNQRVNQQMCCDQKQDRNKTGWFGIKSRRSVLIRLIFQLHKKCKSAICSINLLLNSMHNL